VANGDAGGIFLDAGGVLVFPAPAVMLPPLRAAGADPDLETLRRAHYRTMAAQDVPGSPEPRHDDWWLRYLTVYVAECGIPADRVEPVAAGMAETTWGIGWTHVAEGTGAALTDLAGLGLPMGVVSNSDGTAESWLRRLGVCYAPHADQPPPEAGVQVGVVVDSAVAGVAKPDPAIFAIALAAIGLAASPAVMHVGDSLRYDVTGALAAGLTPVHLDPYGFCPAPAGHRHVTSLAEVAGLAAGR
jgi:putative hydrolase of the HAD superfamily